jgi:hypothetical protein
MTLVYVKSYTILVPTTYDIRLKRCYTYTWKCNTNLVPTTHDVRLRRLCLKTTKVSKDSHLLHVSSIQLTTLLFGRFSVNETKLLQSTIPLCVKYQYGRNFSVVRDGYLDNPKLKFFSAVLILNIIAVY